MNVEVWKSYNSRYLLPTIQLYKDRTGGYVQLSWWKWHLTFEWTR